MNEWKSKLLIIGMLVSGVVFAIHNLVNAGPIKSTKYVKGEIIKTFSDGRMGKISWRTRYITAKGMAPAPPNTYSPAQAEVSARDAAILDAQRYLLEMTQGVQVDVTTCVSDYMVSEVKRKHIEGIIKDYEITKENWERGIYRITMQIPMGKLVKVFVNEKDDFPGNRPANYTGLVIDTRDVDLTPAIFINVFSETGERVFGPIHTTYRVTEKNVEDIHEKRLGKSPLRIMAKDTSGKRNVDIVISDDDANEIRKNVLNTEIFSKGKVVVVID